MFIAQTINYNHQKISRVDNGGLAVVVLENVRDITVVALQKLSMLILVVSTMRFSKCVSDLLLA